MGWTNTLFNTVIVQGPTGLPIGIFVYTPGTVGKLGNPPILWVTNNTTDPFGNVLPAKGHGSQNISTNFWADLGQGAVLFSQPGNATPGQILADGIAGITDILSPTKSGAGERGGVINIYSALAAGSTNSLPQFVFNGNMQSTGGIAAQPTVITTDSWQTPTLLNGWVNLNNRAIHFRLQPNKTVQIEGRATIPVGVANPSVMFTLPTGYRPATRLESLVVIEVPTTSPFNAISHYCEIDTSTGNVSIFGAMTAGNNITFGGEAFPLDGLL